MGYVLIQWIQQMILHNLDTGVIATPAPIVSRVFQDLSTGVVITNNVSKVSHTPFPFPYAQTLSTAICLHAGITPFVFALWSGGPFWAALFTFTAVFLFSCLNFIAAEIEQPFGNDANDIDLPELQRKFNDILVTMLSPQCTQRPMLKKRPGDLKEELKEMIDQAETCWEAFERTCSPSGDRGKYGHSQRRKQSSSSLDLDMLMDIEQSIKRDSNESRKVSRIGKVTSMIYGKVASGRNDVAERATIQLDSGQDMPDNDSDWGRKVPGNESDDVLGEGLAVLPSRFRSSGSTSSPVPDLTNVARSPVPSSMLDSDADLDRARGIEGAGLDAEAVTLEMKSFYI